jgi:hypothetical protein
VAKAAVIKLTENLASTENLAAEAATVYRCSACTPAPPDQADRTALADGVPPGSAEARAHAWMRTELQADRGTDPALAARLITRLAAGRADRPSGCHLSVHDDLDAILACPDDLRASISYAARAGCQPRSLPS